MAESCQYEAMEGALYVLLRGILWVGGMAAAAFPVFFAGGFFSLDPTTITNVLNRQHLFRDLFYLVVVASVLAISGLIQYLAKKFATAHTYQRFLAIFALIFFIVALAIGFVGFTDVPVDGVVSETALPNWRKMIVITLMVSFIVEISMAISDKPSAAERFLFKR